MLSPMLLGPLNGGLGLLMVGFVVYAAILTLRRVHRGEAAPHLLLAVALLLPLLLASIASTVQHDAAMAWAMGHPQAPVRQTYMAAMLSRTLATQLYAGLTSALGGLGVLIGALLLVVRGERTRWMAASVGGVLLVGMMVVAVTAFPAGPVLAGGLRIALYLGAGIVSILCFASAHRRGPGVQLATLVAVSLPLIVVGIDLASMGGVATVRIQQVALAPVSEKQALMDSTLALLDTLRHSSWLGLCLAGAMSLVGPVLAWRTHRTHAIAMGFALLVVLGTAGMGLTFSMGWMAPWR